MKTNNPDVLMGQRRSTRVWSPGSYSCTPSVNTSACPTLLWRVEEERVGLWISNTLFTPLLITWFSFALDSQAAKKSRKSKKKTQTQRWPLPSTQQGVVFEKKHGGAGGRSLSQTAEHEGEGGAKTTK